MYSITEQTKIGGAIGRPGMQAATPYIIYGVRSYPGLFDLSFADLQKENRT